MRFLPVILLSLPLAVPAPGEEPAPAAPKAALAAWDVVTRVAVGGGYRDNVLRGSQATESSTLFYSTADVSLIRLSETGSQLTFFLLGEDTRYFDAPSVNYEQVFSASAQAAIPASPRQELGCDLQYLYQRQVLDVSETEAELRRVLVDGHSLWLRPRWKHTLRPAWFLQLEGACLRQFYAGEDLDDYWEGAARLSLIHRYGWKSEASLGYLAGPRYYDTRDQFDAGGAVLTNRSLVYWRQEVAGQWRHHWDAGRHWRTTTKAGYLFSRDNGSGYFDYDRMQLSQQVRWANHGWDAKINARFGWYLYEIQQVASERRERSYYSLDFRVERRLGKHWFLYATAEAERNSSNDPLDEYETWAASGGIGAEF